MEKCRICGSIKLVLSNKLPFFNVLRCETCDVRFADKLPTNKRVSEIYSKSYYVPWTDNTNEIPKSVEIMKRKTFKSYLSILSRYIDLKGIKILDIGCATGFLLDEAKKCGCDCWGVELNPFGAKVASMKHPNRIFTGIIEDSKYKNYFFDAIMMIDLIEHTKNPKILLKEVKRILKKEGYALLVTPNVGGLWSKMLGKKWTNYKEEHLYYFDKKSLKYLIEKLGFIFVYGQPVKKTLTLRYISNQLDTFKTPVLTSLVQIFKFLPSKVLDFTFTIETGDYLLVFKY